MDVKEIPDNIDIAIVSGSVRNEENKERLEEISEKAKTVIAYGTCACYGGITCMADLYSPEEVSARSFSDNPSTEPSEEPSEVVPKLLPIVHPAGDMARDRFLSSRMSSKGKFDRRCSSTFDKWRNTRHTKKICVCRLQPYNGTRRIR